MADARTLVRRQVFTGVVDSKFVELSLFRIVLIRFIATHKTCVPTSQNFMQPNPWRASVRVKAVERTIAQFIGARVSPSFIRVILRAGHVIGSADVSHANTRR